MSSLRIPQATSRLGTARKFRPSSLRSPAGPPISPGYLKSKCFSHKSALHGNASSVDPTEVSHFNNLASSWWDPIGPSRILHLMNPLRHTFISDCVSSSTTELFRDVTYLDVGCGGGIFAESAARKTNTKSVTAIDPSSEVLSVAQQHQRRDPQLCEPGRLTYYNIPIEELSKHNISNPQYDVVTLFEVIEHVNDPSTFLQNVMPHVKPGGWLIMSTIARTWTSWFVTKLVAEDVMGVVPRGTHEWAKYINEDELRIWFSKQEGWGKPKALGCLYVPGVGWRKVGRGEEFGNYFFGVQKLAT